MQHRESRRRYGRLVSGVLGLTALGAAAFAVNGSLPGAARAASTPSASVTVNANHDLGPVPAHPFGVNEAAWDSHMNDSAIPGLLKAAGITAVRYPGGSWADIYDWKNNTLQDGFTAAPKTDFSDFMKTAQAAGAMPIITVNYGTGTPALAAAWVKDADVAHQYGITYWEVGNEIYGNGFYGNGYEADSHASKSPDTYARNFLQFQSAMRAVNPNIKVCATMSSPGSGPQGAIGPGDTMDWNHTVLSIIGKKLQCVIVHDFPRQYKTAAGVLGQPATIPSGMVALQSEINEYAGSAAVGAQILTTATDSIGVGLDSQPGALFTADTMMTYLENGSVNVDYWDEHNAGGVLSSVDGVPDYNDQGMFSAGDAGEPAVNTPFASYYGIEVLSKLVSPGGSMVAASASNSLIRSHAVRAANGGLNLLIENEDPGNSYTVGLNYSGFTPSGSPEVYTLGNGARSVVSSHQGSASSVTVAPYSLTVLQIPGRNSAASGGGGGGAKGTAIGAADNTSKCVTDHGDSAAPGTPVQLQPCNGTAAQRWNLSDSGAIQINGRCLATKGNKQASGTLVQISACTGANGQQWFKGTRGTLANKASGKCLDDPASRTANGTQLDITACAVRAAQQWKLPKAPIISAAKPGKCVTDHADATAPGTSVQLQPCSGGAAQHWNVTLKGTIQINGRCLATKGSRQANGTLVQISACTGGNGQQWIRNPAGTLTVKASGKCLAIPATGTQLDIRACNGSTSQRWKLP